ncbi:MAG: hypothetical protein JNL58_09690 [Planctomyces sp.]|nr:hypothetical protein [Planctomyces sp.]
MNISTPVAPTDSTSVRLDNLKQQAEGQSSQTESAERLGRELEALFVSMMMKQMRQSSLDEGLFPGDRSDTLGGIFDDAMGKQVAEFGGLGVAELIQSVPAANRGFSASVGRMASAGSVTASQAPLNIYRSAVATGTVNDESPESIIR